ncbi:hypothetical protein [Aquimarina rhabdastrellae]
MRIITILLIIIGAGMLIAQMAVTVKNYYIQSIGIVLLMLGVYMLSLKTKKRTEITEIEDHKEEA